MTRHLFGFFGLILVVALTGCGENQPPPGAPLAKPYPVHGTITFPNKVPLVGGIIYFSPTEVKAGSKIRYEGACLVDAQGNYKIGFNGDGAGVPAGQYKVTILPRDYQELPNSNSESIPPQYREKSQTPLTLTVKEEDNTFEIELK